jgi:hypothetical protein
MTKPSVCQIAEQLVNGNKLQSYGPAQESFESIAAVNSVLLRKYLKKPLDPHAVSMFMIGLKAVRHSSMYAEDNLVDLCGYALLCSKLGEGKDK